MLTLICERNLLFFNKILIVLHVLQLDQKSTESTKKIMFRNKSVSEITFEILIPCYEDLFSIPSYES